MKTQLIVLMLLAAGSAMAQGATEEQRKAPSGAEFISRLDKNGDGKVSKTEFDGPADHFTQLDKDGDGYIAASEAPSGPPPQQQGNSGNGQQGMSQQQGQRQGRQQSETGAGFVTRLDKDGDGKVSKTEFDGPADVFTQLDKNSDGYLGADEAPSGPPQRQQR